MFAGVKLLAGLTAMAIKDSLAPSKPYHCYYLTYIRTLRSLQRIEGLI